VSQPIEGDKPTRTPPDRVAQTSGLATSTCHGIGVPSAEADDTTIDMKPQQEPSTQEVLAGLVERVTFHNDDNGFCVLRIKARGHRDLITVVGHAATISSGEWVTASGEWINDHTHGQQFKARFMRTSAPTSIDGIEKYLGSGISGASARSTQKSLFGLSARRYLTRSRQSLIACAR
jgi:hypothetical protein